MLADKMGVSIIYIKNLWSGSEPIYENPDRAAEIFKKRLNEIDGLKKFKEPDSQYILLEAGSPIIGQKIIEELLKETNAEIKYIVIDRKSEIDTMADSYEEALRDRSIIEDEAIERLHSSGPTFLANDEGIDDMVITNSLIVLRSLNGKYAWIDENTGRKNG